MANLPGTSANNTIAGTSQADSIVGFEGNDSITAANGNDAVWGGDGNDSLFGGGGNDTLYGDQDRVATWGYRVYDRNFTSANNQAFTIESGTLRGSGLATGFDPTNHVLSARGTSGDPNDFGIIYTSTFTATTAGTYTFRLTSDDGSTMRLLDASGTPLVWSAQSTGQTGLTYLNNDFHQAATTRQASVTLAAGQTYTIEIRVWENEGAQVLSADVQPPGSSSWQSLSDNTTFIGTGVYAGNDSLDGGAGDDLIFGGGGNDSIWGGAGADTIYGGEGNDTIQLGADANADLVYGGEGNDSILTEHTSTSVADTVHGDGGDDVITGGSGIELIFGGTGNDTLFGGAGNDTLHGDENDDRLEGGDGNDQLFGGSGNDTLIGGTGNDAMQGGTGSDRFVLLANHGNDTITGGEDTGDVDVVDATALTAALTVSVTGFESGTLTGGGLNTSFSQIERLELGSGNDTVTVADSSQPIFVDGNGGIDRLTVNGGPVGRNLFVLNDNAAGTFTPGNGAPAIDFGPSLPMKLSNILAAYKTGTFVINGTTPLSGQIGQVVFEDFESLNLQMICFVRGARIRTPGGERAIEDLRAGDLVDTLDRGPQPIRWVGSSRRAARGDLAPVLIRAGALGNARDLRVSPQHRMLVEGWPANLLFGEEAVLVPAKALVNGREVVRDEGGVVEYFHMLFDRHEIVWAEGCASESFHPGEQGWNALDAATRAEVLALFPVLAGGDFAAWGPAARPSVRAFEGRALARMLWPAVQRRAGRKPAAAASAAVQNQRSPLAAEMRVAV
ncbi:MAG: Hint domain-containing protein [Gemmobacter sp.]|uniref:Hint domain-containing protein n=1 Tax=Gemmobacter sp. TaxID=1898957 RepID=UPI00391D7831